MVSFIVFKLDVKCLLVWFMLLSKYLCNLLVSLCNLFWGNCFNLLGVCVSVSVG